LAVVPSGSVCATTFFQAMLLLFFVFVSVLATSANVIGSLAAT